MSQIITTSAPVFTRLFARLAAAARRALELHLQTCAAIADAHRPPH
jgi:hypothetical protein